MRILAIIPARGGSKGVPRKNIKLLGGRPLIQYSIDVALLSACFDKIMVSTDDAEIAKISKQLGAEVPELRPPHLANDNSATIDTVIYTLNYYKERGESFDAVCLLQPTCPFRDKIDLESAIHIFSLSEADSLVSVSPIPHQYNPHWAFFENEDKQYLRIATGEKNIIPRRQSLPEAYYRNGSIYLTRVEVIIEKESLYGDKMSYWKMDHSNIVNIDTMTDWIRAENMVNSKLI